MKKNNILNATGITTENIDAVISSLKKQIEINNPASQSIYMLLPFTYTGKINRKKYKGRGRPSRRDYHRHSMMNLLKKVSKSALCQTQQQ